MELNKNQAEAAAHNRGPCLVLAGPGSGKTTVITKRVRYLIEKEKVPPRHILVVTFTKAAAREMQERFLRLLDIPSTEVAFGTFHSVFFRILRSANQYESHNIVNENTKYAILAKILRTLDPTAEPDRDLLQNLLGEISFIKNNQVDLSGYQSKNPKIDFKKAYKMFNGQLEKEGALDFDDILLKTYELLRKNAELLRFWQERFRYILIDEFQDINPLQYAVIRLLAAPENNLFIVGDDDQSVYGFRGARPHIMLNFSKDYRDARQILLDVNYRSTPEIVKMSLRLIDTNKNRFRKKLRAGKPKGEPVEFREFRNETEECEWIIAKVLEYRERGTPLHEMAVLVRTNTGALPLMHRCMERNVPFVTRDRVPNVFMHFVAKPLFAALNWTAGNRTRGNFLRFMNTPPHFIRRDDLMGETVDLQALSDTLRHSEDRKWMGDRVDFLAYQLDLLSRMQNPFAMVNYFRKGMGYDGYVLEMAEEKGMNGEDLIRILDEIQDSARDFEDLAGWYRHIAAFSKKLENRENKEGDDRDKLVIATLHGSKGLEYRQVFIPDLNERNIPHEKAVKEAEIEEERRMLYVGMTRAGEGLHLSAVKERFGRSVSRSRFLREIL